MWRQSSEVEKDHLPTLALRLYSSLEMCLTVRMSGTAYEDFARMKKATKIATVLVENEQDLDRAEVVRLAGVKPPSQRTWELALLILEDSRDLSS